MKNIFGRIRADGNVDLFETGGDRITVLDDVDVWPVGSQFGARYEHPEGITVTRDDANRLGIWIED